MSQRAARPLCVPFTEKADTLKDATWPEAQIGPGRGLRGTKSAGELVRGAAPFGRRALCRWRAEKGVNSELPDRLKRSLAEGGPGAATGPHGVPAKEMARYRRCPADARQAGVLVLLYPHQGSWHLPLTLRPAHLPDHPGQVSLPGGALLPGETAREAAVREFCEELGVADAAVEVLGALSPVYVHASRFRVEPWVAWSPRRPEMHPSPDEVAALLEVPLAHLMDPRNRGRHMREDSGRRYWAPHFQWHQHRIWGATWWILSEFVALVEGILRTGETL